jgi:hypothetical protein
VSPLYRFVSRLVSVRIPRLTRRKYKDGSIVPAMYTYAISWGILLPYFPEHYPAEDPTRADLGAM